MLKKRQLGRAIPCHCFFCFVLFLYKCVRFFRKFSLSLVVLCAKSFVKVIEKRYCLLSLFKPILQYRVCKSFCMPMSKFSGHLFLHLHSTYWIVFLAGIFSHFSVMFFFLLWDALELPFCSLCFVLKSFGVIRHKELGLKLPTHDTLWSPWNTFDLHTQLHNLFPNCSCKHGCLQE